MVDYNKDLLQMLVQSHTEVSIIVFYIIFVIKYSIQIYMAMRGSG